MGKPSGFVEWPRTLPDKRPVEERRHDFQEFTLPLSPVEANHQSGRCMDCGVPFCQQGCPLGNLIPDFNDAVYRGQWKSAWESLTRTNNFPEFTGRLCPAPCEAACVLGIDGEPVTIEQLEKEIIERAFAEGWVRPRAPATRTGQSVAVVGSGPAGLAAAAQLNQAGLQVTLFERAERAGGLLRYGIPDFKLEKWVIDRRLRLLEAEGITFRTGADVGVSPTWAELRATHDAVVIATGATRPRALDVEGHQLAGVVQAMPYLESQNRALALGTSSGLDASGLKVVILGGGDTGSDCLGTALRQQAATVTQLELLPAPPSTRDTKNPWPQWPQVFRTSSSQAEGGQRLFARRTFKLEGRGGQVVAMHTVAVALIAGALRDVPGTEERLEVDLLIQAMGFLGPDTAALVAQTGVALDPRGNVKVDARFATSVPGLFAAGDAARGASLIVWAIAEGRELAKGVQAFLAERARLLRSPT